jgi:hypothetical protein
MSRATKANVPSSRTDSYRSYLSTYRWSVRQRIHFGFGGKSHSSGSQSPIRRALIRAFPRCARGRGGACGAQPCD